jgi:hypothetical protein
MSVQEDITRLVDVFACSDGCVDFVKFRFAILDIEERAKVGDTHASQLVDILTKFRRLTDALTR